MSDAVDPPGLVARATADDWQALRRVRLAALADAPDAFASSLARELAFTEERWRSWPQRSAVFIGWAKDNPVGLVSGMPSSEREDWISLVAMWVAPTTRGSGMSAQLLDAVVESSSSGGARGVDLWVVDNNEPARRLYLKHGFVLSGRQQALPRNPNVLEAEMTLVIAG